MSKSIQAVILTLIAFDIAMCFAFIRITVVKTLPVIDCDFTVPMPTEYDCYNISNEDAFDLVCSHFNIKCKIVFEDLSSSNLYGYVKFLPYTIVLHNNLDSYQLITTLAHEFCHLKYFTLNETYTEYISYQELASSANTVLLNASKWLAYNQCTMRQYKDTPYDIAYYIIKGV